MDGRQGVQAGAGQGKVYGSPSLVSYGSVASRTLAAVVGSFNDNMAGRTMMFG